MANVPISLWHEPINRAREIMSPVSPKVGNFPGGEYRQRIVISTGYDDFVGNKVIAKQMVPENRVRD